MPIIDIHGETISVNIEGNAFDIEYTAIGMRITGIETDNIFGSLILNVDVINSTGILNITFDRTFFDSYTVVNDQIRDDEFIIISNVDVIPFTETITTMQNRTLDIKVPFGFDMLEIIGSHFGNFTSNSDDIILETPPLDDVVTQQELVPPPTTTTVTTPPTTIQQELSPQLIPTSLSNGPPLIILPSPIIVSSSITPPPPPPIINVVQNSCSPGMIFENGRCVDESRTITSVNNVGKTGTKNIFSISRANEDLPLVSGTIEGFVATFIFAGFVAFLLGLMAIGQKRKNRALKRKNQQVT